ncbi:nitroreductase family protein [Patulibacter minatonensis]|uniref:nitroreductase family protein n=1 Tax=Patulibacter minatonensis TaxID=298163 RepID=UPI0004B7D17E|nr:nitroreductase family protein [Patulibacter minatonensis]
MSTPPLGLEEALRTRRTHKAYGTEPVPAEVVTELVELAAWAPNHHLTEPWRFRVVGPETLAALKAAGPADAAKKLDRAPTLIVASVVVDPDPRVAEEDRDAAAAAVYGLLLAAHARGLAGYWRTPAVLLDPAGRAAAGLGDDEAALGLIHLGPLRQDVRVPDRRPVGEILEFLA